MRAARAELAAADAGGRRRALLAWGLALVPFALLAWRFDFVADDAYISFRYARNLARGDGLVYNPGLAPVEGYSNLLWVLVLALGERLGAPSPVLSRVLSLACGAALLLVTARWAAAVCARALPVALGALFLAPLPPLAAWSTGGLATVPLALCLLLALERLLADPARARGVQAGLVAALACLLRADGAVLVAVALVAAGVTGRRTPWMGRALLACAGLAAAAVAAQIAFRLAYYGDWLPNTARAKLHPGQLDLATRLDFWRRGLAYGASFLAVFPSALVALASGLLARGGGARLARGMAMFVAGNLAYAALAGGDFMALFRFLVPSLAPLALVLAAGLDGLASAPRPRPRLAVALACAAIALSLLPAFDLHATPARLRAALDFRWNDPAPSGSEYRMWRDERDRARQWAVLGRALARHTEPGESIFLGAIGAVGYHTELEIVDSYGMVTPEVVARPPAGLALPGHDRQGGEELFRVRPPDYLGARLVPAADPWSVVEPALRPPNPTPGARLELRPLDPAEGFPPGIALLLVRREP